MGPAGIAVDPGDRILEHFGCDVVAETAITLELFLVKRLAEVCGLIREIGVVRGVVLKVGGSSPVIEILTYTKTPGSWPWSTSS